MSKTQRWKPEQDGMALYQRQMANFRRQQKVSGGELPRPLTAKWLRRFTPVGLLILLSGCTQLGIVRDHAAGVADGSLEASVYGACVATSVGALVRRYGNDPDGRAAWELFCGEEWRRGSGEFSLPRIE